MSANLTPNGLRVLAALRTASVLRREPGTLTPDGYERWFSLRELAGQNLLDVTDAVDLPPLESAANGLYRKGLVQRRTQLGRIRYHITEDGSLTLAEIEARAGVADLVGAELDLAQAEEDIRQAQTRTLRAAQRLAGMLPEYGMLTSIMIVLKTTAEGQAQQ